MTRPPQPVSVAEIVQMSKNGTPALSIIETIRRSGTVYRLSASQLADLRTQGVADKVLNYMQHTYLQSVRRNQRLNDEQYWTPDDDGYSYGGYPYGWDDGWYPDEPYDLPDGEPSDE